MLNENETPQQERRHYLRLDSVFPVQFQLVSLDGQQALSDWIQGFTSNIGKGGICLNCHNLKSEFAEGIKNRRVKLSLGIEMPLGGKPVRALAHIAWVKESARPGSYLIGAGYDTIDSAQNSRICRYALTKKFFAPVAITVIVLLGIGFGLNMYVNVKLVQGNKGLVHQLVSILQESTIAQQKIKQISHDKNDLQLKLESLQSRIQSLEEEKEKKKEEANKIDQLNTLIGTLNQEKGALQEQLISLQRREDTVTEQLLSLEKKKGPLEKANLDKMYQWLKVHQNPRTGLIMSFEGDGDISNWAFIYDQSLVIQAFTYFSDFERAKKILNFFDRKARRVNGRFVNAYYANDGSPAEFVVHSGPNIWLGIAAVQYTKRTKDNAYVKLAEEIAHSVIALQNEDEGGGIRGGPEVTWYATEHNLDAYAFFNMLVQITNKQKYAQARDKVLNWLVTHTYDKEEIPIKRGKGDATIATDTYAWSVAAIGPEKLDALGMNPDRIMEFAETNCAVEVSYKRPEGAEVKIKGFDFAAQQHVARGGVVSSEWTAQMIISFKKMADFYYKKDMPAKGRAYEVKAEEYLTSLGNMIISSPSPSGQGESCLPYATQDFVDTGHGWMTPKGSSTGSVAGTTYSLFAYYNYNPLELY
jgi:outer membrane murein-binding lipoprotein Lpp